MFIILIQISKLSMIPVVCFLEWLLNGKHYSSKVKIAVVVVVVGVGVCTVTDVKMNAHGFLCASVAVLCTSLQQIVSISHSTILLFARKCLSFTLRSSFNTLYMLLLVLINNVCGTVNWVLTEEVLHRIF